MRYSYSAQHGNSTKTHLLELPTMIHVVRKQIKCLLVNKDHVTFLLLDYVI